MMRRTPLKPGKGFTRKVLPRPPRASILSTGAQVAALRRGAYTRVSDAVVACPKEEPYRDRHLLDMAMGGSCLIRAPGVWLHDIATVVACHGNSSIFGKGGARKADDCYTVRGCWACHCWLDSGMAPFERKLEVFMAAHLLQVQEWREICARNLGTAQDRKSAMAALQRLNATPVGEINGL